MQDCYFSCEYHGGHIALRDQEGLYLALIGSRATLKTRSKVVTKDELFSLEDSLPQASFVAASNTRYVSVKQGKYTYILQNSVISMECVFTNFPPGSIIILCSLCCHDQICFLSREIGQLVLIQTE